MTRVSNRRSMALALVALIATFPFTSGAAHFATSEGAAGEASTNPPASPLTSVEFAKAQLRGATPEQPAASQQALLAKPTITHADYEVAMRAMASCVEQRIPGATVELYPGSIQPQLFDFSVDVAAPDGRAEPLTDAGEDPNSAVIAQCQLAHSAYVQDGWLQQQPPALETSNVSANVEMRVGPRS